MFFFPISIDAPVYHRLIGTYLLIAANVACFFITGGGNGDLMHAFELEIGNGLHPLQWISCHFAHFGVVHLLTNMVFLFIYGLVVEGKVGVWRFLAIYFAICWVSGAVAQVATLRTDWLHPHGAAGASMAIFGLMVISLLWAPRNNVGFMGVFILMIIPRVFEFELSVFAVGCWFLFFNLLEAWFYEFAFGSAVAHLLGGLVGFGMGYLMLKLQWVDCEGWDFFSLRKGDPTEREMGYYTHDPRLPKVDAEPPPDNPDENPFDEDNPLRRLERLLDRFREHLADDDLSGALKTRKKIVVLNGEDLLTKNDLLGLVRLLIQNEDWDEAVQHLERTVLRFPGETDRHRLKLAELLLLRHERPQDALDALKPVDAAQLDARHRKIYRQLVKRVKEALAAE